MQLDLALFLRLSRTLEGTQTDGQLPLEAHVDVLRSLDHFLLTVSERMELLRTREIAEPPGTEFEVEELEETKELPLEEEVLPVEEAPPQLWTREHDLLYEDILWLFRIGDNDGALVSLGRLLSVAGETQELARFLDINESKLVTLYQRMLGPFDQPLAVAGNGLGDRYFWNVEEAQAVLRLGRENGSVGELLEASPLPRMRTLALVHRMRLEGLFTFRQGQAQQSAS